MIASAAAIVFETSRVVLSTRCRIRLRFCGAARVTKTAYIGVDHTLLRLVRIARRMRHSQWTRPWQLLRLR
jgi:hypothetical protein